MTESTQVTDTPAPSRKRGRPSKVKPAPVVDLAEERTKITGPLNAAKKAVDALFRPMRDLLDSQDTTIVGRLAQYLTATRATQTKALEAVAGGARDAATLEVAHATPATPFCGT